MIKLKTIIITGTPGVGKSTISKNLALELIAKHLDVSKVAEEDNVIDQFDLERDTAIVNLNKLSKLLTEEIESSDTDIIVDGHLAPYVIPDNLVTIAFILRRNPQQIEEELMKRGYSDKKVKENVCCEILDVCLLDCIKMYGEEKCHEIDTTNKNLNLIIDELEKVIKDLLPKRIGIVDWLELISNENKLDYYFE